MRCNSEVFRRREPTETVVCVKKHEFRLAEEGECHVIAVQCSFSLQPEADSVAVRRSRREKKKSTTDAALEKIRFVSVVTLSKSVPMLLLVT